MSPLIKQPVISEKALLLVREGWYTFVVDKSSNKHKIARQIEETYNVHVVKVRTISIPGRMKRSLRRRQIIKTPDQKKALVKLKKGEKIEVFSEVKAGKK